MGALMGLTVGQIVGWVAGIVAALSIIIEFNKKINFKPITVVLNWVGKRINQDLKDQITNVSKELDDVKNAQAEIRRDIDRRNAVQNRVRILRFGDEITHGQRHSKEGFDQVLEDIDEYEHYCAGHPEFVNNRTIRTKKKIIEAYDKCLDENDFD